MIFVEYPPTREEFREQVERICQSQIFAPKKRLKQLLRYLTDAACSGKEEEVTENALAFDVFDKTPADFDPQRDSTVRTSLTNLRNFIRAYYGSEGKDDRIGIEIKGNHATAKRIYGQPEPFEMEGDEPLLTADEMQEWLGNEIRHLAKAMELRMTEATDFVHQYAAGVLSPERANRCLRSYHYRWGDSPIPGLPNSIAAHPANVCKGMTDDEINVVRAQLETAAAAYGTLRLSFEDATRASDLPPGLPFAR
jgi:hypothetical protein